MTSKVLGWARCALLFAALTLGLPQLAHAQANPVRDDLGRPFSRIIGCDGVNPVSAENPFCVTGGGGGGGGAGTEYTEDAALPANPIGGVEQCRRRDTLTASEVSADGDAITGNCTPKGERTVRDADVIAQLGIIDGRVDGLEAQMTSALAKLDTVITNTDRTADVAESASATAVKGAGTAGTADTAVLTVQGIAGGVGVPVTSAGTTGTPAAGLFSVQGLQADDAALGVTPTNPVPFGGKYMASTPTYADGDRVEAKFDQRGNQRFALFGGDSNNKAVVQSIGDGNTFPGQVILHSYAIAGVWNGASYDRVPGDVAGIVTQPWAKRAARWNYAAPASGLGNTTTAVTIKAAAGALTKNCVVGIQISADPLGTAGEYAIRDGAAGPVLWRVKIQTAGLPTPVNLNPSMPICGSDNTLLEWVALTASGTGAVYANFQGHAQVP